MTTRHTPGRRQRAILAEMRDGAQLYRIEGERAWQWYLGSARQGPGAIVALHVHGYIMFDVWQGGRGWYALTEQGKRAVGK